jgi:Uri superfamily endonuclease
MKSLQSYQLYIKISRKVEIQIGKLGFFSFPKGTYIYTGSAKINIEKRIKRHLSKDKKNHWHIDYLLSNNLTKIVNVIKSNLKECELNAKLKGKIVVNNFGSSDCKNNCKSHLKLIEKE